MSPEYLGGVQKALWWAEWQANTLVLRIFMPRMIFKSIFSQIYDEQSQTPYFYLRKIMERTFHKLGMCFGVLKYEAKLRALQLGYKCAEGALLFVDGEYHFPFTFNPEALGDYQTFILDQKPVVRVTSGTLVQFKVFCKMKSTWVMHFYKKTSRLKK